MILKSQVTVGKKFDLGPNRQGLLRVLEVTDVTSVGVVMAVIPGTWSSGKTEMFVHYNDHGFWNSIRTHKEKIVHRRDVIWYRIVSDRQIFLTTASVGFPVSSGLIELSRTTVEYIEEK